MASHLPFAIHGGSDTLLELVEDVPAELPVLALEPEFMLGVEPLKELLGGGAGGGSEDGEADVMLRLVFAALVAPLLLPLMLGGGPNSSMAGGDGGTDRLLDPVIGSGGVESTSVGE